MSGVQPFQFEPTYPPGEEPVDSEEETGDEGDSGANFDNRVGNTEWCICGGNCVPMSTADECFCCQELEVLNQKFDESGVECITDHAKFRIGCVDTDVLNTALVAIHNARCNPLPEPIENRTWRLAAYRQFTWWVHGVLGRKNRRVIPGCVVKAIRNEFPEESGEYAGFKPAEIDLN
ncbi:P2X purinoceptor 7-like [Montipora capricornis]|uniref:P2X purinoceptor 7-like n=1 Tax=Montipora capricornis TaxID=246305 RepID=UPI0035F21A7A